jgi:membrane protein YqaA with SNARE-associated domain
MRKAWEWFQARAASKHAEAWLAALSFSESSFFLIPPDALLIPMLAAGAGRWVRLALITTVASVVGAIFGYIVGYFFFEQVAEPIIAMYSLTEEFAHVGSLYAQGTFIIVLLAAFTPIPFKVFVLAGGFFAVPFTPFLLASMLGRGGRFFLVAWLAHRFGPRAAQLFLANFKLATVVAVTFLGLAALWYFNLLPFVGR